MRLLWALCLVAPIACVQVLGGERDLLVDDECESDGDCSDGEACDDVNVCRPRCNGNADCGAWRYCAHALCSSAPGAPCDADSPILDLQCGKNTTYVCQSKNAAGDGVLGYCAPPCVDGQCPDGFSCMFDVCRCSGSTCPERND